MAIAIVILLVLASMVVVTALRGIGSSWPVIVLGGFFIGILVRDWLASANGQA